MSNVNIAAKLLLSYEKVLVISHASPDGDTLGSAAALIKGLNFLGKKTAFLCGDKHGKKFDYLFEGLNLSEHDESYHVVTVDVADPKLMGKLCDEYKDRVELAIDHHATHVPFGKVEWVSPNSASNCEMIFELLTEMNVLIDKSIATKLYTGIATDTGCFKFMNTTADTHMAAANLISLGADFGYVNKVMFETKTRACMETERKVLSDMSFHGDGKIALVEIPLALLKETGAEESEVESITAIPRTVEGVLLGITLKEKEGSESGKTIWKASVRASEPCDASVICKKFGGGGHKGAAGCTLGDNLALSREEMIKVCLAYLKEINEL